MDAGAGSGGQFWEGEKQTVFLGVCEAWDGRPQHAERVDVEALAWGDTLGRKVGEVLDPARVEVGEHRAREGPGQHEVGGREQREFDHSELRFRPRTGIREASGAGSTSGGSFPDCHSRGVRRLRGRVMRRDEVGWPRWHARRVVGWGRRRFLLACGSRCAERRWRSALSGPETLRSSLDFRHTYSAHAALGRAAAHPL